MQVTRISTDERQKETTPHGTDAFPAALSWMWLALLRDTNLPVAQIAEQTGFGSAGYFIKTFGRQLKVTLLRYRRNFQ